jgi:hypothetical protein
MTEEEGFPIKRITVEGNGRLRIGRPVDLLAIYKWEGDHLVICWRLETKGRPTSFGTGDGQDLLILRRVRP